MLKSYLIFLSFFLFTQQSEEEELIIGTWIPEGNSEGGWVFYENGNIEKIYGNKIYKTFKYEIYEGKSADGTLEFNFLRLTNINKPNDVYEYEINGISEDKMTLEYLGGTRSASNLLIFTKKAIAPN